MVRTVINIVHLQPIVPHYREEFFSILGEKTNQTIYVYEDLSTAQSASFNLAHIHCRHIASKMLAGRILFYNPFKLLSSRYDVLVLMLNFTHFTSWLLLFTKFIHRKKIILWGQGISVKRYLQEERRPDWKLKWQIALADGIWFYMNKEKKQWQNLFPKKPMVALNNTLTDVDKMMEYRSDLSVVDLKKKYYITQDFILIFCARFGNNYRRVDLLLKAIEQLDAKRYGFVIIGAGKNKPSFLPYTNVYDFDALYDVTIKRELFALSDIYFQPGWVGLSIVEAMAYGKPVFTFKRSEEIKQCVEYSYLESGVNGMIFADIDECIEYINFISKEEIKKMGNNARCYVKQYLSMEQMVENAMSVLDQIVEKY